MNLDLILEQKYHEIELVLIFKSFLNHDCISLIAHELANHSLKYFYIVNQHLYDLDMVSLISQDKWHRSVPLPFVGPNILNIMPLDDLLYSVYKQLSNPEFTYYCTKMSMYCMPRVIQLTGICPEIQIVKANEYCVFNLLYLIYPISCL